MIGQRFGNLVVTADLGEGRVACRCDCGAECVKSRAKVRTGWTKSCGCLRVTVTVDRARTHGLTGTKVYVAWKNMHSRCDNPRNAMYRYWGARGIRVCERWRTFENFLADMGQPPSPQHSMDRIDPDGHYEPGNCRWATARVQAENRRHAKVVEWDGRSLCLSQWAELIGVPAKRLQERYREGKRPPELFHAGELPKHRRRATSPTTSVAAACG